MRDAIDIHCFLKYGDLKKYAAYSGTISSVIGLNLLANPLNVAFSMVRKATQLIPSSSVVSLVLVKKTSPRCIEHVSRSFSVALTNVFNSLGIK